MHRHDDVQVTRVGHGSQQTRAGGAANLERDLAAAHRLQRVAQKAHVEGDLHLATLDTAVEAAGIVPHLCSAGQNVHVAGGQLVATRSHGDAHDVGVVAAK